MKDVTKMTTKELISEFEKIEELSSEEWTEEVNKYYSKLDNEIYKRKQVEIIFSAYGSEEEVKKMYFNLDNYYPEFQNSCIREEYKKEGEGKRFPFTFHFYGECEDGSKLGNLIRLTHHAERLYKNTKLENVHVEVYANGKWYGR